MEEDGSGGNGNNVPSPVESSLAVCGGIEIKPFLDKSCNPEDVETAQNQQESMMEYHELEGCLDIKSEEPDIKEEEDECDSVMAFEDTEMEAYMAESYNPETNYVFIKSDPDQNASEIEMESPMVHPLIEDVAEKRYYCKLCPYVTKRKGDLSKYVPIHRRSLETRTYDCSFCSYKTKYKAHLTSHMSFHKDASEITTYDCSFCSYKTKHKRYLPTHMLIHKGASDITTYQCTLCPYEAKQKRYLFQHMLIHKDASEVTTYDCSFCSHKTKRKGDLRPHTLTHMEVSKRKEPAKRLTLEQKLELINHAKNGVINVELCKMYNICKSSVTEILGKKEIYLSEFERRRKLSGRINTKKCTGIYDTPFEKSVFHWFLQRRTLGEPVSAVLLRKFAKNMYTNFYEETDFKASDGWLRGFKDRHGIRTLNTKGEKLSADTEEAQAYYLGLNAFIKDNVYDYDNIYNADETAYYYKHLPTKTLVARHEIETPGHNQDRLTLQVCANATGTDKVPLMAIGKVAKPRGIKHVEDLPVFYKCQSKGWMNQNLFIYWYTEVFLPHIKARKPGEHERFLLILDNAPAHPSAEILNEIDPQCLVVYLPLNVTSIIQPMDQGVISSLKRKCKMAYLREILGNTLVDTCGMAEFIKSWTIKDCLFLIYQAWSDVSAETLRNAWGKLIDRDMSRESSCQDSTLEACNLLNKLPKSKEITLEDTSEWLQADSTEDTWRRLTDEEIIAAAQGYPIQYDSDTELHENENDGATTMMS